MLPEPDEVGEHLAGAALQARSMVLREPRPAGFPLLFTADCQLIEPAVAYLHEHFIQRAHTADTLRTYAEILYDWFETLEQNAIAWGEADAVDLVAYRNRMLLEPSGHTGRPYPPPPGVPCSAPPSWGIRALVDFLSKLYGGGAPVLPWPECADVLWDRLCDHMRDVRRFSNGGAG